MHAYHVARGNQSILFSGVPCEFVTNFNPAYLVLVGVVLPGEDRLGYMKLRLKKHRWYKRILKTNDPLILSVGWRRFQTVPVYCIEDHNGRQRMIKYTPQHLHCIACCYGNVIFWCKVGRLCVCDLSKMYS